MFNRIYCLEVTAPRACFTNPVLKTERVSYEIPTPSAVQGIFDAILRKPAFRWVPVKVEILNPIHFGNMMTNEVKTGGGKNGILIEQARTQRNTRFLKNVRYRIHARMEYIQPQDRVGDEEIREDGSETPMKYHGMFERRASQGQAFYNPHMGLEGFHVEDWKLIPHSEYRRPPQGIDRELGLVFYGYKHPTKDPRFFPAVITNGVVLFPEPTSKEIIG